MVIPGPGFVRPENFGTGGCLLWLSDAQFRASKPLARLSFADGSLTIEMWGIAKWMRRDPIVMRCAEMQSAGLCRSRFVARGVAVHLGRRGDAYLWVEAATARRILACLETSGVRVVDGVELAHW